MTNLNILLPLYNDWRSCNILIKKINEQLRKKKRFGNILILDDASTQKINVTRLGLKNIGYQPRNKWPLEKITPTENDKVFRQQLIHGDVHDQGAAMLGGVAGHAGLFSNANDLAVMMQLFMQYGIYGQDTLLNEETVKLFTSSPYYQSNKNRRGIAFDKPVRNGAGGPTCFNCASTKSFGHSGFTGTLAWADPENGFVYVFLSNRVHPNAENKKLITMNIRTRIQKVFIEAINKIEDH